LDQRFHQEKILDKYRGGFKITNYANGDKKATPESQRVLVKTSQSQRLKTPREQEFEKMQSFVQRFVPNIELKVSALTKDKYKYEPALAGTERKVFDPTPPLLGVMEVKQFRQMSKYINKNKEKELSKRNLKKLGIPLINAEKNGEKRIPVKGKKRGEVKS
jgi:hypothetical protein